MNKEIEEVVKELSVVIEAMASEKNSKIKGVLDTEIRKAVMYQKADWLRSEIEKFEVTQREHFCTLENGNDYDHGAWDVYDSIITRYKEELNVLESK